MKISYAGKSVTSPLEVRTALEQQDNEGLTALHHAVKPHRTTQMFEAVLTTYINQRANTNILNDEGDSPIHLSAKENPEPRFLLIASSKGLDMRSKNGDGKNIVHCALENENQNVLKLAAKLVGSRGINERDSENNRPIDIAAKSGDLKQVSMLIELGAER